MCLGMNIYYIFRYWMIHMCVFVYVCLYIYTQIRLALYLNDKGGGYIDDMSCWMLSTSSKMIRVEVTLKTSNPFIKS